MTQNYDNYQAKRTVKQLFMALIFVAIIAFGWHYPLLGFFIPLCMLLGLGIGISRGRKWCDWYCPRGSFYDALFSRVSLKKKIPLLFKNIFFRLGVVIVLMGIMGVNLFLRWPGISKMGVFLIAMLTATTLLGVILAVVFHQRSWCMICPIGTLINLSGGNRRPLRIDSDKCVECKLCAKVCPMQIKPYTYKSHGAQPVRDRDCLRCGLCVSICPKKALKL